jgi:hypothetical protein
MKRLILRADLLPQSKAGVEQACARRGMTQLSVISRLILWFADQDKATQKAILNDQGSEASAALLKDLLRRLGK